MRLALAALLSLAIYLPTLATDRPSVDILGRWVGGTWPLEGKMLATGFTNPATLSGTTRCSWSPDHVFVLCDQQVFVDGKSERNLGVYSFGPNTASYHYVELSPEGREPSVSDLVISADGNRWEYRGAQDVNGKPVQFRSVNEYADPDHITWWTEYSTDNGVHWTKMNSGTETRKLYLHAPRQCRRNHEMPR